MACVIGLKVPPSRADAVGRRQPTQPRNAIATSYDASDQRRVLQGAFMYDFDLFTIGGGSGGVRASRVAARLGARVALAERADLGGTCVNVGCIPKKLFSYAAHFHADFADAAGYGWSLPPAQFDWTRLRERKDAEIARLNGVYQRLLDQAGVRTLRGHARLIDDHTVAVEGTRYSAQHILIATGGRPQRPDIPGAEHGMVSDQAFHLKALPERAVVVGGGYIAVEFASIWNGLGVKTTLVHRGEQLLRGFDTDLGVFLADQMRAQGIDLQLPSTPVRLETGCLFLAGGKALPADQVLFATGRVPNTADLGLAEAGVALDPRGAIQVDERFTTTLPSVYAVGDCINRVQLTPVALAEGTLVAEHLFGARERKLPYKNIPSAVFSHPNVASVGLAEHTARARGHTLRVFRSTFTPLRGTLGGRPEKALLKLVVDATDDRVLGVHMVGPEAGEVIQGFAVALNCGARKADLDRTIGIHPTVAEEFVTMREAV
jgi:glutathione reductase (NADPH)